MKKLTLIFAVLAFLILVLLLLNRAFNLLEKKTQLQETPQKVSESIKDGQIVLAAGDIGECIDKGSEATATAKLLDKFPKATILTLGDNVYTWGRKEEYESCFESTWGRNKSRIFPSLGNHDQEKMDQIPYYYEYFGERAGEPGKGYYSFNLENWHLVAVNTNILVTPCNRSLDNCKGYFEQMAWIKKDLEQNKTDCTLIYGHHPRFTSQTESISYEMTPLWKLAYSENVDIILNGHVHNYERFSPQDPEGRRDPEKGVRQFIVGTGGAFLNGYKNLAQNSKVVNDYNHGVLKLVLGKGEYEWEFLSTDGSFVDKGRNTCH